MLRSTGSCPNYFEPGKKIKTNFAGQTMTAIDTLTITKLVKFARLLELIEPMRQQGARIVWTSGCFDILHAGHIVYLKQAKTLGDVLIVGLNSDESVRSLKGANRPLVSQFERALILDSIVSVDYIIIFDEPRPFKILQRLRPDVYVKGGDYTIETIDQDERSIVEANRGEVVIVHGLNGFSTSALIKKIADIHSRHR